MSQNSPFAWFGFAGKSKNRGLSIEPRGSRIRRRLLELDRLEERVLLATIDVNSVAEGLPVDDGACTLREAITAGNTNAASGVMLGECVAGDMAGTDTITFAVTLVASGPATIDLTEVGDTTIGPSALRVSSAITIVGPSGDSGITINRTAAIMRLFYVDATGVFTLQNLTLTNGRAQGGNGAGPGGPTNEGGGGGGAGLGGGILNQGQLTVQQSTLSGNLAVGGTGGNGGIGGFGGGGGDPCGNGGLPVGGPCGGGQGGGMGTTTGGPGGFGGGGGGGSYGAPGNRFGGNGGFGGGGGGASGLPLGQPSRGIGGFGGGDGGDGGGGSGGSAGGGGGGLGGAVFNYGGTVTITNSTLSGNAAQGGAGGLPISAGNPGAPGFGLGGGLFNLNGTVNVTNSTLANNATANGDMTLGSAGAIFNLAHEAATGITAANATLTLQNTILADSTATNDLENVQRAQVATINATEPNIVETAIGNMGGSVNSGGVIMTDPVLGMLTDNGGPTDTHALGATSPAIDQGKSFGSTTDQRGFVRPVDDPFTANAIGGDGNDIGAFEFAFPDFGDAPTALQSGFTSDYPTTGVTGASHIIAGPRLGTLEDGESNGQPSAGADGDDLAVTADEDGAELVGAPIQSDTTTTTASLRVNLQNAATALLDGWIDFNRDGDWLDMGEQIFTNQGLTSGDNSVSFTVPAGTTAGDTFARLRVSSAGSLTPGGPAADGEVEDYPITIGAEGSPATVDVNPGGGAVTVLRAGSNTVVQQGGVTLFSAPTAGISSLSVNGTGDNDTFMLDLTAGNPIPANGVTFNGSAQTSTPGDSLHILGGAFVLNTYRYTNANDGIVELDPDGAGLAQASIVFYTGLEPITNTGTPADIQFFLPTGPNTDVVLSDDADSGDGESQLAGSTFETTVFANPTNSLTILMSDAGDTITVASIDSAYNPATITSIVGSISADTFNIRTSLAGGGPIPLLVEGNDGNDVFNLGSATNTLNSFTSAVAVFGDAGTSDTVNFNDQGHVGADFYTLSTDTLTRTGGIAALTFMTFESVVLNAGMAGNVISVTGTFASTTSTTVNAGDGNDSVDVGNAGSLDSVLGPLTVNGDAGTADGITFSDQSDIAANTYTLRGNRVDRLGAATVTYRTFESLFLNSGAGASSITVEGTHAGTTEINGGGSADSIIVLTTLGATTVNAGGGDDTIDVSTASGPSLGQVAFASLTAAADTSSRLATVNLTTGAATQIGTIGGGLIVRGIAVQPASSTIFAVNTANTLISFAAGTPGTLTSTNLITGLQVGEQILGIDFRPATGQLYALGITGAVAPFTGRIYTINTATGAATQVGMTPFSTTLTGASFGFDFNPVPDRIRIVSDQEENLRVNPDTGALAGTDTALNPPANVVAAAYDRNFVTSPLVTLFDIDSILDSLLRQGGVNGTPSPNLGALTVIGPLGFDTTDQVGFDISGGILGALTINGDAGANDAVNVNDQADFGPNSYTITNTSVTRSGAATISYSTVESLAVNASAGNDAVDVRSTAAGTPLTVFGGNGVDVFNVGNATNSLDDIQASVILQGQGGTGDTVNFNDQGDADGNTYTLTNNTLTRSGFSGVSFVAVENVTLNASGQADTINVTSSFAEVSTMVNAGDGLDIINLGNAGTLDNLLGAVTINGNAPGLPSAFDLLILHDESDGDVNNYTVTPTTVARTGIPTINYATIETLHVMGDNNTVPVGVGNTFNVSPSLNTRIDIFGNDPTPPATPGDSLIVDFTGTTGATLTPAGPGAGTFSFTSGHQPVGFTGIETLQSDLTATKTNNVGGATTVGVMWTWTIDVANGGGSDATFAMGQTILTDNLPNANVTYGAATATNFTNITGSANIACTILANDLTCTAALGAVTIGAATGSFDVQFTATPTAPGTFANPRTAGVCTVDPNNNISELIENNNACSDSVAVTFLADVTITKTDSPEPVIAGNALTYTLTVHNNGPQDATDVTVTDVLPAEITGETFCTGMGCDPSLGAAWTGMTSLGTIPSGEDRFVVIRGTVNPNTANGTMLSNTATVTTTSTDPNLMNNADTETTTVNTQADLSITKTDAPDPVIAGTNLTYTITTTNGGPSDAQAVQIVDATPANTTFVSAVPSAGGVCMTPAVGGTGTVTCDFAGATAPAGTRSVTLVVNVNANAANLSTITNTATTSSATTDPVAANNSVIATTTVNTSADLSITKTDSPDPVIAGTNETYTITATNGGASDAQAVQIVDATPANTTFVSAVPSAGGVCMTPAVGGTGTVTCDFAGATAPAGTRSVTLVVNVNANAANLSTITNTATTSSATTDPVAANNSAIATTMVNTSADLSITKNDSPDPVVAGTNITYTITATDNGPSDAQAVQIVDATPANTTFVSATPSAGGVCMTPAVGGTGTVTCDFAGATAAGSSRSLTLVVNVNANTPSGAVITNTATTSSTTTDPNAANNADAETTDVITSADLAVAKTDSPDPVIAGTNLTYTITTTNNGPSDAQAVQIVDATPANTTFVSATPSVGGACMTPAVGGTGTVTCDFVGATVPAGTRSVTLVVKVNASAANLSTITNTATTSSATTDPVAANNSAIAMTTVNTSADLVVTKTDSPDPVIAGTNETYTITVTNNGPSDAQTVSLTDAVPANTTFVSFFQLTGPQFTLTLPSVGGTGTVTASLATFAAGASASFRFIVSVNASAANLSLLSNTATGSSATTDPTPGNNADTETTTVNTEADLSITKSDSPDPVLAGNNLTYTLTTTNNGPSDAQGVQIADATPANTTFVLATPSAGGSCTTPAVGGTGTVTCTFAGATVPAGVRTVTLVVNVNANTPDASIITNTATNSSATTDPTPANDSAVATTTVNTQADLSVTKTDSPDPVTIDTNLTFTVTVTNNGPSDAQTVSLMDTVPTNTTFVSNSGATGWTCMNPAVGGTGTISCTNPTLAAGASSIFTIVVHVDAAAPNGSMIANTATVATATTDPTAGNDAATSMTLVQALDYGDAPDPLATTAGRYPTLQANNGARHVVGSGLFLGASVETDNDGQPNATATGDDATDGTDDENGVTLPGTLFARLGATTTVTASAAGLLDAWVDFNRDGDWLDAGEQIATNRAVVAGANSVSFSVPAAAVAGTTFARFRISSAGGLLPTGQAADGEVEDYSVQIVVAAESSATLIDDPLNPGQKALLVLGNASVEIVSIKAANRGTAINVKRNQNNLGSFDATQIGRIIIFGLGGNDTIKVNANVDIDAQLQGGDGADTLRGGGGNTIVVGGDGNDTLRGGRNRNLLIGGAGVDSLTGGSDILIGGITAYDANDQALTAILAEWKSATSYNDRVARLRAGTGGVPKLDATTVFDDLLANSLKGGRGLDWFFQGDNDQLKGRSLDEFVDAI